MTDDTKKYFEENALPWLDDAYGDSQYTYPVGEHRVRILLELLQQHSATGASMLDIGCGGGRLVIEAAARGFRATGIDQSAAMIEQARWAKGSLSGDVRARIDLVQADFRTLTPLSDRYDFVSAMGLLEYLPDESALIGFCAAALAAGGVFAVDCRNRLFNLASIGPYTRRDIEDGTALSLAEEIESLYQDVPLEEAGDLVACVRELGALGDLAATAETPEGPGPDTRYKSDIEGKQQTPREIQEMVEPFGFDLLECIGVHPHLLVPRLNYLLPFPIFNRLSDVLLPLERLPIALTWSSKFIAVFRRRH